MLLAPVAARARAILIDSTPPNRAAVPAGPRLLVLHYSSPIDPSRSSLTLEGTNARMVLPLEAERVPDALAARLELTPGAYHVHWQVLAADGTRTSGELGFTVTGQ